MGVKQNNSVKLEIWKRKSYGEVRKGNRLWRQRTDDTICGGSAKKVNGENWQERERLFKKIALNEFKQYWIEMVIVIRTHCPTIEQMHKVTKKVEKT